MHFLHAYYIQMRWNFIQCRLSRSFIQPQFFVRNPSNKAYEINLRFEELLLEYAHRCRWSWNKTFWLFVVVQIMSIAHWAAYSFSLYLLDSINIQHSSNNTHKSHLQQCLYSFQISLVFICLRISPINSFGMQT